VKKHSTLNTQHKKKPRYKNTAGEMHFACTIAKLKQRFEQDHGLTRLAGMFFPGSAGANINFISSCYFSFVEFTCFTGNRNPNNFLARIIEEAIGKENNLFEDRAISPEFAGSLSKLMN